MIKKPTYNWKLSVPVLSAEEGISITNYPLKEKDSVSQVSLEDILDNILRLDSCPDKDYEDVYE